MVISECINSFILDIFLKAKRDEVDIIINEDDSDEEPNEPCALLHLTEFQKPVFYSGHQENMFTRWVLGYTCKAIAKSMVDSNIVGSWSEFIAAPPLSTQEIEAFHTPRYLKLLENSGKIARLFSIDWLENVPLGFLNHFIIDPLKYRAGASKMAGELALLYGYALCIGGGMANADYDGGRHGSVFADISMSIQNLVKKQLARKITIIDLSMFQGTGYEIDKLNGKLGDIEDVYIVDIYNTNAFPQDKEAKSAINRRVEFSKYEIQDEKYLALVHQALKDCTEFTPDIIYYNANTQFLYISEEAIAKRDASVFAYATSNKIPIVMMTGQFYCEQIIPSIQNLFVEFNLELVGQANYRKSQSR